MDEEVSEDEDDREEGDDDSMDSQESSFPITLVTALRIGFSRHSGFLQFESSIIFIDRVEDTDETVDNVSSTEK